jgi:hypothetical protein
MRFVILVFSLLFLAVPIAASAHPTPAPKISAPETGPGIACVAAPDHARACYMYLGPKKPRRVTFGTDYRLPAEAIRIRPRRSEARKTYCPESHPTRAAGWAGTEWTPGVYCVRAEPAR